MSTQHTPGPWIVRYREAGLKKPKLSVEHSNPHGTGVIGLTLALLPLTVSHAAESRANARIIAAAPDLLLALKELLEYDERDAGCIPTEAHLEAQDAARAAIAKAEGR